MLWKDWKRDQLLATEQDRVSPVSVTFSFSLFFCAFRFLFFCVFTHTVFYGWLNYTQPILKLQSATCRMGSHGVTCHRTQVNAPRLNPCQYSIYLLRRDERLSWPWCWLYFEVVYMSPQTVTRPSSLVTTWYSYLNGIWTNDFQIVYVQRFYNRFLTKPLKNFLGKVYTSFHSPPLIMGIYLSDRQRLPAVWNRSDVWHPSVGLG